MTKCHKSHTDSFYPQYLVLKYQFIPYKATQFTTGETIEIPAFPFYKSHKC